MLIYKFFLITNNIFLSPFNQRVIRFLQKCPVIIRNGALRLIVPIKPNGIENYAKNEGILGKLLHFEVDA